MLNILLNITTLHCDNININYHVLNVKKLAHETEKSFK